jgi:hypothetical protein
MRKGINSESEKLKLSWKNVNFTVKAKYSKKEKEVLGTEEKYHQKQIIKDANGYVDQAEALFIMGSSG